jgi:hypothetical protein
MPSAVNKLKNSAQACARSLEYLGIMVRETIKVIV